MILKFTGSYRGWNSKLGDNGPERLFPKGIAVRFTEDEQETAEYFLDSGFATELEDEPADVVDFGDYPGYAEIVEKKVYHCPLCGHETPQPNLRVVQSGLR